MSYGEEFAAFRRVSSPSQLRSVHVTDQVDAAADEETTGTAHRMRTGIIVFLSCFG